MLGNAFSDIVNSPAAVEESPGSHSIKALYTPA